MAGDDVARMFVLKTGTGLAEGLEGEVEEAEEEALSAVEDL